MTRREDWNLRLSRRHWLVTAASLLAGCGGGGTGSVGAALPGTGGTGIGVQGPITGFGSVIVNNTQFDDSVATVLLDDVLASPTDLRIGMVANISGQRDASGLTGSADQIEIWSIAKGVVNQTPGAGSFELAGMVVQTDSATALEGLTDLASIAVGKSLVVWGLQVSTDARTWKATRVALLPQAPATVSTGLLQVSGGLFSMNGINLTGGVLRQFADGQLLRVEGSLNAGELAVARASAVGSNLRVPQSGEVELEGLVTKLSSATGFMLGTIAVDASRASVSPANQAVTTNSRVEVYGSMQNGVLLATKLEIKGGTEVNQVDITATIDAFVSVSDFYIRGQQCDASQARVHSGALSDLRQGLKVRVLGIASGEERLIVTDVYASMR
jgi:hypothetical protein